MPKMPLHNQAGFTYIGLMVATLVISIMTTVAVPVWITVIKREKEEELLFRLQQYRTAIERFRGDPQSPHFNKYPQELEDLLDDRTSAVPKRYLRRLYTDPITGKMDWVLEREAPPVGFGTPTTLGGITSIHSRSEDKAIKKVKDKGEKYSEW